MSAGTMTSEAVEARVEVYDVAEADARGAQRRINAAGGVVVQSSPVAVGYQFTVRWPE